MKKILMIVLTTLCLFSLTSCKENPDFVFPGVTDKPTLPQVEKPSSPLIPLEPSQPVEKPSSPLIPLEPSQPINRTIKVYNIFSDKFMPYFEEKIKQFELNNPGWKIEFIKKGGYDLIYDAIIQDMDSNTQPAIAFGLPSIATEILNTKHKDKLINIEERFIATDKEFNVNNFIESYYNDCKINNSLYSLPYNRSSEVMFVNTDLLDSAGVTIDELATWDGLFKVGGALDKLKTLNLKHAPIGFDYSYALFMTLCEQYGIPYLANGPTAETSYLFNNEKAALVLENLAKEYEANKLTTKEMLGTYISTLYIRQDVAISVGRSAGAYYHDPRGKFNYEVLPYPKKDINSKIILNGLDVLMFEQENDEIENMAWEFAKTLYEDDLLSNLSIEMAVNPVTKSVYDYPLFNNFLLSNTLPARTINTVDKMKPNLYTAPIVKNNRFVLDMLSGVVSDSFGNVGVEIPQRVKTALENAYKECVFRY